MRKLVRSKVADLTAFRHGKASAEALQKSAVPPDQLGEIHPAHAIYAQTQNQMSIMAELLLELEEMKTFDKFISAAQDDYMPSWPPMSPVTDSFFWCWANADVTVNAHRETLGSVTLAVGAEFGVHPDMLALMRLINTSRMSVYRVEGHTGTHIQLCDLVSGRRCSAICESGYNGIEGELWFVRVLPPPLQGQSDHVVFTSPYVLIAPDLKDWTQYLDRIAAKDAHRPRIQALERHFKWGPERRYWTEFVFEGYVNHRPGAIYLEGLPDVPASRPQSPEFVRDGGRN
jgi:hypothetical protein